MSNQNQSENKDVENKKQKVNTPQKPRRNKSNMRGKQGRKDSKVKRVNFDNVREDKFDKDLKKYLHDAESKGCNDISWYNQDPMLTKSAGSIPFFTVLGNDPNTNAQKSGIMTLLFEPSIGSGKAAPYAINQAATSNYSFLVHANSRNYSQDPADYTLFELAGIEVFAAIADLIRAYGIVMDYDAENAYKPRDLLEALQFDPDAFIQERGQLWFAINELITRSRQIWIPDNMPYLQRQYWLNSGVYTDAPGTRSQMYVFVRQRYFMLEETLFTTGTALKFASYAEGSTLTHRTQAWTTFTRGFEQTDNQGNTNRHLYTPGEFVSMISLMIQKLTDSQDRGQIYGNILNAYTANRIFALNQIDVSYTVRPIYNAEVLTQIENAVPNPCNFLGGLFQDSSGQIWPWWDYSISNANNATVGKVNATLAKELPGTNEFVFKQGSFPNILINDYITKVPSKKLINFHQTTQPTPEQVMIATRLTSGGTRVILATQPLLNSDKKTYTPTDNMITVVPATTGSEHLLAIEIWTRQITSQGWQLVPRYLTALDGTREMDAADMGSLMAFDWHPFMYASATATDTMFDRYMADFAQAYGDTDNYDYIDDSDLAELNNVALYSEFGVHSFGK